jgi:hypothetical protein
MSDPTDLPKVPPFVRETNRSGISPRATLSVACLVVSLISLGVAMAGGGKLAYDAFVEDRGGTGLGAKLIVLAVAYLIGWFVALYGMRVVGNLVLPLLMNVYAWLCLAWIAALYIKIMSNLYRQTYSAGRFWLYLVVILAGFAVLAGLHLLIENHNLIPFAVPLLILCLAQLILIVYRYVFTLKVDYRYLWGDLTFFIVMAVISCLMLASPTVLGGLRHRVDGLFHAGGTYL